MFGFAQNNLNIKQKYKADEGEVVGVFSRTYKRVKNFSCSKGMQQASTEWLQSFRTSLTYSPPKIEQVAEKKTAICKRKVKFGSLKDMAVLAMLIFFPLGFLVLVIQVTNSTTLFTWSYPGM